MKLASILGIRGARDKPKDSYNSTAYSFFFGRSTSGKNVNERTAMQTTAVYSCVRILSEAIASLPVHLYRNTPLLFQMGVVNNAEWLICPGCGNKTRLRMRIAVMYFVDFSERELDKHDILCHS